MPAAPNAPQLDSYEDLPRAVSDARWYHTLELPPGIVTPGEYDLRPTLSRLPLPKSLEGKRCLDVGTRDGFWAYEMERRGASEVIAIDLDDVTRLDWPQPPRHLSDGDRAEIEASERAFWVAHSALRSKVIRLDQSVYDLVEAEVGTFDFAITGTLLHHLRDPIGALMAIRRVLRGLLLCNELFSPLLTVLRRRNPSAGLSGLREPFWWIPNIAGLTRYIEAAGFEVVRQSRPYLERNGPGAAHPPLRRRGWSGGLRRQILLRLGSPHVAMLARPVPE